MPKTPAPPVACHALSTAPDIIRAIAHTVKAANDREDATITLVLLEREGHCTAEAPDGGRLAHARFPLTQGDPPLVGAWRLAAAALRDAIRMHQSGEIGVASAPIRFTLTADAFQVQRGTVAPTTIAVTPVSTVRTPAPLGDAIALQATPETWRLLGHFAGADGIVRFHTTRQLAQAARPDGAVLTIPLAAAHATQTPTPAAAVGMRETLDLFETDPYHAIADTPPIDLRGDTARRVGRALESEWTRRKTELKARPSYKASTAAGREAMRADARPVALLAAATFDARQEARRDRRARHAARLDRLARKGVPVPAAAPIPPRDQRTTLATGPVTLTEPLPTHTATLARALDAAAALESPDRLAAARKTSIACAAPSLRALLDWAREGDRAMSATPDVLPASYVVLATDPDGIVRLRAFRPWPTPDVADTMQTLVLGPGEVPTGAAPTHALAQLLDLGPNVKTVHLGGAAHGGLRLFSSVLTTELPPPAPAPASADALLLGDTWAVHFERAWQHGLGTDPDHDIAELIAEEMARGTDTPTPRRPRTGRRSRVAATPTAAALLEQHIAELRAQGWWTRRLDDAEAASLATAAQAGDLEARDTLALSHSAWALRLAYQDARSSIPLEIRFGLAQEAALTAAETWQPGKGTSFPGWMRRVYTNALIDAAAVEGHYAVSFWATEVFTPVVNARELLTTALGRRPSALEIAAGLQFPVATDDDRRASIQRVETALRTARSAYPLSIDAPVNQRDTLGDFVPAPVTVPEAGAPATRDALLARVVATLPAEAADVLATEAGLGGTFQLARTEAALYMGRTVDTLHNWAEPALDAVAATARRVIPRARQAR